MFARRHAALVVVIVAAGAAPAAAHAQEPTLALDRQCYTEDQEIRFTGSGYTPGGDVLMAFGRPGSVRGMYPTNADAAGAIADFVWFDAEDDMLDGDEDRGDAFVTANDQTRIAAGAPQAMQFAAATFTFTRWFGLSPGRYVPGRRASVEVFGWAFATGKTAWLVFRKGSRTVASVKVGRIEEPCGDRRAKVRIPRSLAPGSYRVALTTKRRGLSERYTWRRARVSGKGAAASSAAPGRMAKSPVTSRRGARRF